VKIRSAPTPQRYRTARTPTSLSPLSIGACHRWRVARGHVTGELINVTDRGRLAPGTLADVIAVPGNPLEDITVTQKVSFVMKGGKVFVQ